MRFFWLPICCLLAGAVPAQADSYRDGDEGFNPFNMMQGMPTPMNLFDSSDRSDHPRHPPPPRMAPGYAYPPPPAYGRTPHPMAPYQAGPVPQPPRQSPAQPPVRATVTPPPQPGMTESYEAATPPPAASPPSHGPIFSDTEQPAYSFRPMSPQEPAPAGAPAPTQRPAAAPEPSREMPSNGETVLTPPYSEKETPMVNGHPAVFRPMHLGADNPPDQ